MDYIPPDPRSSERTEGALIIAGDDDIFEEPTDPEIERPQDPPPSLVSVGPGSGVRVLADVERGRAPPPGPSPEPPLSRPPRRFAAPSLAPSAAPGGPSHRASPTGAVPLVDPAPATSRPPAPTVVAPITPLAAPAPVLPGGPAAAAPPGPPAGQPPSPPRAQPLPSTTPRPLTPPPPIPRDATGIALEQAAQGFEGAHPSQSLEPLRPGETVAGRYTIVGSLGQGGMAEVYLAELCGAAGFTKTVVLKRILPGLVRDQRFVELFVREAHVASSLTHANVVQLYELGEDRGTYYISMEYVRGMTLADLARRAWKLGESLPLELLLLAAADAAEGLSYGWRTVGRDGKPFRLVHRDVSPDNLIINTEGMTKVLDYGIAKGAGSANLTMVGELKGKMSYIPPEEIKGTPRDHRSDLYALGTSLYWLATHKMPFEVNAPMDLFEKVVLSEAPPPRTHNPALPKEVDRFILKLMAKEPTQRFQDGQDVVDAVLSMLGPAARRGPSGEFVSGLMRRALQADEIKGFPVEVIPALATTDCFDDGGFDRGGGTFRRLALKLFGRD